jgi:hypothetical protein
VHRIPVAVLVVCLAAAACSSDDQPSATTEPAPPHSTVAAGVPPVTVTGAPATAPPELVIGSTQPPDGNRVYGGAGTLPDGAFVDVPLPERPLLVAGVPLETGTGWVVTLTDGRVVTFTVSSGNASDLTEVPAPPPFEMPPVAVATTDGVVPAAAADENASPWTPPLIGGDGVWWVSTDGSVFHDPGTGPIEYQVDAMVDGRIVADGSGRVAILSGPTDAYPHGVLGDRIEASTVTIIDSASGTTTIAPDAGPVIEGISPMWVDADGDGILEILVTLSDAGVGARVALAGPSGFIEGPPIGQGSRWRHQIGAAPIGPAGESEIVVIRTPHLGGIVEFYRLVDDELRIVATVPGLTSHVLGSRNLDLALIADADGDGSLEVVAPTQDRTELGAVRRTPEGAEVAWTVPLDGLMVTNLAAVESGGVLWLAAGREDAIRIWGD